jgi:dTDP-4-dehydrorhamnose reductase
LGQEFLRVLGERAVGLDRSELELGHGVEALARVLAPLRPVAIINASAFNQVDAAETQRRAALAANALGPEELAQLCAQRDWPLVHFSTDYVFGADELARLRTEADPPAPINFYGYSKLIGETAVLRAHPRALAIRVAHLFGGHSLAAGRANLVERFVELARQGKPIYATRGQVLNPTSVIDLVPRCLELLDRQDYGLFHLTGEGTCSAIEFANEVLRLSGLATVIVEVDQDARPARRARHTALENRRWNTTHTAPLPHWRESLASYLSQPQFT